MPLAPLAPLAGEPRATSLQLAADLAITAQLRLSERDDNENSGE
ncbi:MAG TPA: hypothetical protein VFG38_14210 [Pseudomonadales bacterium]|nr:hypothetical protein [Pseudomonadales bacterium]